MSHRITDSYSLKEMGKVCFGFVLSFCYSENLHKQRQILPHVVEVGERECVLRNNVTKLRTVKDDWLLTPGFAVVDAAICQTR